MTLHDSTRDRTCLELWFVGFTQRDIAEALGTTQVKVSRAIRHELHRVTGRPIHYGTLTSSNRSYWRDRYRQ